jgi:leucyl aminopeptidase
MAVRTANASLDPAPSLDRAGRATVAVASAVPNGATAVGVPVAATGRVPAAIGVDRRRLRGWGFDGSIGSTFVVPGVDGRLVVAGGIGDPRVLDAAAIRHAAAAFARAAAGHDQLAVVLDDVSAVPTEVAAQAAVEGILLARYRYDALRSAPGGKRVRRITLVVAADDVASARTGARRGQAFATATMLARDLANAPHNYMSASRLAEVAVDLGRERGFGVEIYDEKALVEMGIGGLMGVNAGSAEPPRMIVLKYEPEAPTGRLAMVGKGIMYDSGGIALKPADLVHAAMKNDMSGAGAILAAFAELAEIGCTTSVTGYLMCTDSMPSGTAMALGDVITIRGGTTIEVLNTDAEGRLVMADALVLAVEAGNDAIVDIATLTGATQRAFGRDIASVFGSHDGLVDQVRSASTTTDEKVWPMPLHRPYRSLLNSAVADMSNMAYGDGGAITAALFLAEFVGDVPWAHIDIAGTAQADRDSSWTTAGCTGFGARLLLELALNFSSPGTDEVNTR